MSAVRLHVLQRATAALMVPLLAIHLFVILYASANGLSAAEILARTQGNVSWALYYGAFVVAASIHAAIGVRSVAKDWLALGPGGQSALMWGFGLTLLALGTRAVIAVVFPGAA